MTDWTPTLPDNGKPRYLAIADALAESIAQGNLTQGARLPAQRHLAERLGLDFTTVARGYVEARKRGLIDSRVGQGSFVSAAPKRERMTAYRPDYQADLSMNLPPEPTHPALLARMRAGLAEMGDDLVHLLRYQRFGGANSDKVAAMSWLSRRGLVPSQERVFITPGAHAALLGIFGTLAERGDTIFCETLTYPGARSIAAQLGLQLVGLAMDKDGLIPAAFEEACHKTTARAVYLNPTLQNPTTYTMPEARRSEIADIARRHHVAVIEDDAYGFIPRRPPSPFALIAPDITWHVAGLSKCIGAGLRLAYVAAPNAPSAWPFAAAVRVASVMASPITAALATRWIEDGTADAMLAFIRAEAGERQQLASEILPAGGFIADPLSFNLWLTLPPAWNRSAFIGHMRSTGIGVVASDAFAVGIAPPEAVRVCLGGPIQQDSLKNALEYIAHALESPPESASTLF